MKTQPSGTQADMYEKYFPGEAYTTTFEPTLEQSASMIRLASAHADNNTRADVLLQMLGINPSESAFNPKARDAWTKAKPTVTAKGTCKHGHAREKHSYVNSEGAMRCRECRRISNRAGVLRAREKKAA